MNPRSNSPTMTAVLAAAIESRLADVHVALPGRVEAYNATTGRADVQPLIKQGFQAEDGSRSVDSLPLLTNVPIAMLGSGVVRVKFPVTVGDVVWVMFASSSLDAWLNGAGAEVDPLDDRRHALDDAIAIPVVLPGNADGVPQIEFTSTEIRAGGTAELALKEDVNRVKGAIAGAAVVAGDGGAAFKTNIGLALAGIPVGTTVLKGS